MHEEPPFQFGLKTTFAATTAVAVFFALPRPIAGAVLITSGATGLLAVVLLGVWKLFLRL